MNEGGKESSSYGVIQTTYILYVRSSPYAQSQQGGLAMGGPLAQTQMVTATRQANFVA